MHSETFLTYGMTIVHLGVSLPFSLSYFFLFLAASILSGYLLFLKTFFTWFLSFSNSCSEVDKQEQWLQSHRREKCFAKPEEVIHSQHSMHVSF